MSYKYFVSIKEVVENYLAMAKPDVIDLRPLLVSRINGYKHLISRI
jgi:hypothetical protein